MYIILFIYSEKPSCFKARRFQHFLSVRAYSGLRFMHNPYWKLSITRHSGTLLCFNAWTGTHCCLSGVIIIWWMRKYVKKICTYDTIKEEPPYDLYDGSFCSAYRGGASGASADSAMQKMGVEPTRYCYHTDLNRARLPIPPLLHMREMGLEPTRSYNH